MICKKCGLVINDGRIGVCPRCNSRLDESEAGSEVPVGNPYGNPYGAPTSNPYSTPYGAPTSNPYSTPYGAPTSNPYSTPYGAPAGNPYGTPYGAPAGNPYGTPYGAPAGNPYGVPYGVSAGNPYGTQDVGMNNKFLPSFILGLIAAFLGMFGGICTTMCTSFYSNGVAPFILIFGGSIVGLIGACKCLSNVKTGSIMQIIASLLMIVCAFGITGSDFATVLSLVLFGISGIIGLVVSLGKK